MMSATTTAGATSGDYNRINNNLVDKRIFECLLNKDEIMFMKKEVYKM